MATTSRARKDVSAKVSSSAKAASSGTPQQFEQILASVEGMLNRGSRLFPGGVNKIQLELKLPGNAGVSLSIEGPAKEMDSFGLLLHTDPAIASLNLNKIAGEGAAALLKAHPGTIFTSGKRSVVSQASAMAENVELNRKWIEQTYSASTLRTSLQDWVNKNPAKKTKAEIAVGLEGVLNAASSTELAAFSKHLSGDAFDVKPVTTDAEAVKKTIRGLKGLAKFLEMEGGLVRWHAEFDVS